MYVNLYFIFPSFSSLCNAAHNAMLVVKHILYRIVWFVLLEGTVSGVHNDLFTFSSTVNELNMTWNSLYT